ncbi:uncharacterized protein [Triticum aestivum]|uniref:uncharacterized protein isoform X3 n=1 Tax=Triticum aestivum TaxID=4565 RepID=UPI001D007C9B|nr:uncharacterized protein LOC123119141 isoform X3 [Triticum aestivum]
MAIVSGTMDVLLPKLAELLTDEFKLHKGLKEEIASLSRELESMQAALVKISEVPVGQLDGQVKVWSREVREMSYDIEDSIDTFTVRFGAAQEPPEPLGLIKGFMDRVRSLWATALTRRQIAGEIQRIKGEVEEVSQRRKRYKLDDDLVRPSAATTIDPRLPALYEDASRLVGMERPTGDLVKWLKEGEGASKRQLKVLSIVGVGGLGKTTLANTVFHMLEGQFQCRAFVSVSLTPDVKKIFRSIIRQVSGEDCTNGEDWDVKELVDHIRNFLKDKRAAGLVFAQEALQGLQRLRFDFGVRETKDLYGDFEFGLENLSSVKRVRIDIDCDGAWVSEVEALEILIKKTTNVYAPILNISRRLEEDMLKHEDIGLANKKEENWPAKNGPWGGNGGRARDIKVAPQSLESVTIRSGSVVDSLAFSFKDGNGRHHTAGPWGSDGGSGKTIKLGPTEFVTEVSGTFGSFGALSNVLTSLTLVTNCGSYGPFGKRQGSPFKTTMQSNSSIVGFFGRAGQFVDAIGVYVLPFPV